MITLRITADQIERAKIRYPFNELKGSVMKGASNIYGALGEIIIIDFMSERGFKVEDNSTYEYDLIINGFKVDVKTSRMNSVLISKKGYECRIINPDQDCHFYFFVKILDDLSLCRLLGYISKKKFLKSAIFTKDGHKGEDFIYRGNGYHIYHNDLNSFKINLSDNQ